MTNEEIWECMQRDLDGDLSEQEQQVLYTLIQKDADLQLMYNRLKTVSQKLEQLPPVVPSFSIVDSILPQLESAAAKPVAVKSATIEESLPTLEVKRKSSSLSESKKWKRMKVWLAGLGSTAVAACLLIGMLFTGGDGKHPEPDPLSQGTDSAPAPVVEDKTVVYGPEAPTPSTNPAPSNKKEVGKKSEETPPKKKTSKPPAQTDQKPPVKPPAQNTTPPASKPAVAPKPVVTEDKPPSFPIGLEEKTDEDDNKHAPDKADRDEDEEKDSKQDKKKEQENQQENDE